MTAFTSRRRCRIVRWGLSEFGLDYDTLVQWDNNKSLENSIEYEGHRYFYRNSHEALHLKQETDEGEGFWVWEFIREDEGGSVSVVKWEGCRSRLTSP